MVFVQYEYRSKGSCQNLTWLWPPLPPLSLDRLFFGQISVQVFVLKKTQTTPSLDSTLDPSPLFGPSPNSRFFYFWRLPLEPPRSETFYQLRALASSCNPATWGANYVGNANLKRILHSVNLSNKWEAPYYIERYGQRHSNSIPFRKSNGKKPHQIELWIVGEYCQSYVEHQISANSL